jgi:hypothetical protein
MSPAGSRPTETTGRGLAHRTWRRIGAAIHEMNYAAGLVAAPNMPGGRRGPAPDATTAR